MNRRHRLTHRDRFAELRRLRIGATHGALRVHVAPNGGLPLRAGFAISGVPKAVLRNRVRRRLRALLQARAESVTGVDLLVSAGPAATTASFAQLADDLGACLARVVPRAHALAPALTPALTPALPATAPGTNVVVPASKSDNGRSDHSRPRSHQGPSATT